MRQILIGTAMIAATALLILCGSARADEQPLTGVNCKSVEGIKETWGWLDQNPSATVGELVEHIGITQDCVFDHYVGDIKEKVGEVHGLGDAHEIFRVQKLAVCPMPGVCMMHEPEDRFISRKAEGTPA